MNIFNTIANNKNPNSTSFQLRKKRFDLFVNTLGVNSTTKILDVGGTEAIWKGTGLEKNVTLLNIAPPPHTNQEFTYVVGDACDMYMFKEKEFDVAFSNSVIEHVGNFHKQKLFAEEIQRVSKKYWVQTPYKHFPIEPHFVFPFFQYLPKYLQEKVGLNWKYSHFKMSNTENERILNEMNNLRLLNKSEFKGLFSTGSILKEKYFGITKSLIAFRSNHQKIS